MAQDAASAGLIIYGLPKNARLNANQFGQGQTDIEIDTVIKPHEILAGRKTITIDKFLPQVDPNQPMKFLIFCDIYKGQLDAYKGIPFKNESRIAEYLKGALAIKDKPVGERLKFFFEYLDDPDNEISNDAYTEYGNSDYKDFRPIAEKLPAEKIVKWLKNPATPLSRLGLYGSMLGHCGNPEKEAAILQELLNDPKRRFSGGIDGVLAGLTILNPKVGWPEIQNTLADGKKEFLLRYAALRAARFLWEYRADVIERDKVAAALEVLLDQADLADLAVEDMRKWSYWKPAEKILALLKKPEFDVPIVRRAVLRYMIKCPASASPAAAAYVADQRKTNPKWVEEVESLLNAESIPIPAPAAK